MQTQNLNKPLVGSIDIKGPDGNAFAILGYCRKSAKESDWSKEMFSNFMKEATAGDYENLLDVVRNYFDIEFVENENRI